jgi:AraC-like DNA-binding protein
VLAKERLVEVDGVTVEDVRCRSPRSGWSDPEPSRGYGLVFVRRGSFRRRVNGVETAVDPTSAYFERPHEEQHVAHHVEGGDACTALALRPWVLARIWGGDPNVPDRPVPMDPSIDLQHRLMVGSCRRRDGRFAVTERAILLVTAVLERVQPSRVASGRPRTHEARRRVVDDAREALAADPTIGLIELASAVAVSPHHLSRIFRAHTGLPLSRYRTRLRMGLALERLAEGESNLAALATDLGFADHSHLGRVIRKELDHTPSWLRASLSAPS